MSRSLSRSPLIITKTMLWALVIGYGFFLVGKTTYDNYRVNREIDEQKQRIVELEREKQYLETSLIYLRSNAFREVEARQRLHLKGADEHVVALPEANSEPSFVLNQTTREAERPKEKIAPWKEWWLLFFGSDRSY